MRKLKNTVENAGCLILFLLIFASVVITPSCKEDGGADGAPVIHYLRVTDPSLADSTFTDVSPGSMIVVVGENLNGVRKVYINNQEISFNANYGTSTSLIITVPADEDFLLSGSNPDIPSELRIVTDHGVATYPMHVLSPGPVISYISAFYPIDPGDEISLIGENFYEIKRIYFTKDSVEVTLPITDYQVSADYERVTFSAADVMKEGYIIMECYTSDASIEFVYDGPKPVITGISSTMPVVGSKVTIVGKNFIDVSGIDINGEIAVPQEDIEVSESFNTITFTMPSAPVRQGKISVTAIGGTAEMDNFYPLENVIIDYDGRGGLDPNWSGANLGLFVADGKDAPYTSTGNCTGMKGTIDSATQWWWQQVLNKPVWPSSSVIPDNAKISELELQFECYLGEKMEGPVIQITMGEGAGDDVFTLTGYVPVSAFTGKTEIGEWMQCSIPLESLVEENLWKDFIANHKEVLNLYVTYPNCPDETKVEIYLDNFRIMPIQKTKD